MPEISSGRWEGSPINNCDVCDCVIKMSFVDGMTKMGPWAIMCLSCHRAMGVGLGTGKGQKYQRIADEWVCDGGSQIAPPASGPRVQSSTPPSRPAARKPEAQSDAESTPDERITTIGNLLTERSERGKQFRSMLEPLNPTVDGATLKTEFGMTDEQIMKYCKGRGKPSYVDDENPYIEGLGWNDM